MKASHLRLLPFKGTLFLATLACLLSMMSTIPQVFAYGNGNGCGPCWQEYRITTPNSSPQGITSDGTYLWFTEFNSNQIGRMDTSGNLREFPIPTPNSGPMGITLGPDGNIWYTEFNSNKIARMNLKANSTTEFLLPTANSGPRSITSDGTRLWFTEFNSSKIGFIIPSGLMLKEFRTPTTASGPLGITSNGTDNLWFTEFNSNKIGFAYRYDSCNTQDQCTSAVRFTEYAIPTPNSKPYGITSDGINLWFTENQASQVARITISGSISSYPTQNLNSGPMGITYVSAYGCLVFTEFNSNDMGFITPDGSSLQEYAIPTPNSGPNSITVGPTGDPWFTENQANQIGHNFVQIG